MNGMFAKQVSDKLAPCIYILVKGLLVLMIKEHSIII